MTVTLSDIHSIQRPIYTVWGKYFIDPITVRFGLYLANHSNITPLALTLLALVLSFLSAYLFYQASLYHLILGAIFYQLSTIADALDGTIARVKPGIGSVLALVLDHSLDPFRLVLNVLALVIGNYIQFGDPEIFYLVILFFGLHFSDWVQPRTISRLRKIYIHVQPEINDIDKRCLSFKKYFERVGLHVILFSVHERELLVLCLGPLIFGVKSGLILAIIFTLSFNVLRLVFDNALLKNEIINNTSEYLGDTCNEWENGI